MTKNTENDINTQTAIEVTQEEIKIQENIQKQKADMQKELQQAARDFRTHKSLVYEDLGQSYGMEFTEEQRKKLRLEQDIERKNVGAVFSNTRDDTVAKLEKSMEPKVPTIKEEKISEIKDEQKTGVSSGAVAALDNGSLAFAKTARKGDTSATKNESKILGDKNIGFMEKEVIKHDIEKREGDKIDLIREYMLSGVYKLFLHDRAPDIQLVIPDNNSTKKAVIISREIQNFKTLTELTGADDNGAINAKSSELQKITGIEDVYVTCMITGEVDYHGSNVGAKGGQAQKIDHGKSGVDVFTNPQDMLQNFCSNMKAFEYDAIPNDIGKFQQAVDRMTQVSDDQIESTIKNKTLLMQQNGINPDNINVEFNVDGQTQTIPLQATHAKTSDGKYNESTFKEIEDIYINNIKQNKKTIGRLSQDLEIVQSIAESAPELNKNSKWTSFLNNIYQGDTEEAAKMIDNPNAINEAIKKFEADPRFQEPRHKAMMDTLKETSREVELRMQSQDLGTNIPSQQTGYKPDIQKNQKQSSKYQQQI